MSKETKEESMALSKIMYTAKATVNGGRDGEGATDDGRFKVKLAKPEALGGSGDGVNPEQLFAVGYAACFLSALKLNAEKWKIPMGGDPVITAEVSLGTEGQGLGLAVALTVHLPGMEDAKARDLVEKAHKTCPYSNATRNNVEVTLGVTTA